MATNDEIRAKDIIPHKTSFASGDGFYGDGDSSFFMEADKLLELTAQNALSSIVRGGNQENLNVIDEHGNILAKIDKGGIETKEFNKNSYPSLMTDRSAELEEEVNIIDEHGNILAKINESGVRTKLSDGSNVGKLGVAESDCVTILASSFGETDAFPTNKHWSGIMSLFSDYRIQILAAGGSNMVTNLYYLRHKNWVPDGHYVLVSNCENDHALNKVQMLQALDNLCTTIKGMGKEPIVATNYQVPQATSAEFALYAAKNRLMFWDCSNYAHSLVKGVWGGFDDGAHLRKRNAPLIAFGYMPHLLGMERPRKSLKVFRVRDEFSSATLDELVFKDNWDRAKKYKEIAVNHTQSNDEYNKLKNKTGISFDGKCLASFVLPSFASDLKMLVLHVETSSAISVYVKNTVASPYPNPTSNGSTGVRFSVSGSVNVPSFGDVYACEGVNYTVKNVVMDENGYYCTIYCTPDTMPSSTTGTLSVVSRVEGSSGADSIGFDLVEEITFDLYDFVEADTCGHWEELSADSNGNYAVTDFNGSVNLDKVDFLITSASMFSITDLYVNYISNCEKNDYFRDDKHWTQNDYIHTEELLPETTFGAVGDETTFWVDGNGDPITSVANYETTSSGSPVFPEGCLSEIVVTDTDTMNCNLSSSMLDKFGEMYLEIWCRYFPSAPTPYTNETDTNVNNDSFDFNKLHVVGSFTGKPEYTVDFDSDIGLFWQIVRIPITWFYNYYQNNQVKFTNMNLSISSDSRGIEICKISLKYK